MGGPADAGESKAGGAKAAHRWRTRCVFEFREGQGSRRDRVCGKARGSCRRNEPIADAAFGRRMEVAIRRQESAAVPISRNAKASRGPVDAPRSFAPGGPVP